jgi:hypothetical protein
MMRTLSEHDAEQIAEMEDFLREVGTQLPLDDPAALAAVREKIDRWCAKKPGRRSWPGLPDPAP